MSITSRYRDLTKEELQELEKEFVDYLIINGITADDWVDLKANTPHKAEDIITLFSDVVFEDIMRKVQFLEKHLKNEIMTFQCLPDRMVLVGIETEGELANLDFIAKSPGDKAHVYTTEKSYTKPRELEIFEMISNGCEISDGKLFKTLSLAL